MIILGFDFDAYCCFSFPLQVKPAKAAANGKAAKKAESSDDDSSSEEESSDEEEVGIPMPCMGLMHT